jgi:signal transduction histidine kinase
VSVIDQGSGVAAEVLEKIFDSYFTTKPSGMGLGLSVCRSIVRAHGGRIWAENNHGRGASFHFSLPATVAETA